MIFRLLDLFCGAGGAAMGYHRAGFEVVGVDIKPQPRYPFEFHQADALEYCIEHGHEFDAIHASPPCQKYSLIRRGLWPGRDHPDLIRPTRTVLLGTAVPYVIENVVGARSAMRDPIVLCGSMFTLGYEGHQLRRHRLFECSFPVPQPACRHNNRVPVPVYGGGQDKDYHQPPRTRVIGVYGSSGGSSTRDGRAFFNVDARREAMGIDWMTNKELSQAIPPAYTEHIGKQLIAILERTHLCHAQRCEK